MEEFSVDSGLFVVIDPAYLIGADKWRSIDFHSLKGNEELKKAIATALRVDSELFALLANFGGDGVFGVEKISRIAGPEYTYFTIVRKEPV